MPASLKLRHIGFLAGLALLLAYQNCGQTQDDTTFNSASSYQETLPFAYDAKLDTIAYMSCSEMADGSYEPRSYFTFRAGAYSSATGGLGMTTAFRSATQYYSNTDRANSLSQSNQNVNTLLSLSIRSSSNFQQLWATDQVQAGQELDAFLPALNSDEVAGPFASTGTGQYVNYFPGSNDQRLMEASLRFLKFENVANDTRNNLDATSSMLVAGFSASADQLDPALRSPYGVAISGQPPPTPTPSTNQNTMAYGTGYRVRFALPAGFLSGDRRVLSPSGIAEVDLTTNQIKPSTWDCATNYEFMIIRPEDKVHGLVICNAGVDRFADANQQAALNAIRRVLRVEDWFVDLDNHCVLPKRTGDLCYGTTLGTRAVSYGVNTCVDSPTAACPHFVSVCIKH